MGIMVLKVLGRVFLGLDSTKKKNLQGAIL
jgi:hypothetical protein